MLSGAFFSFGYTRERGMLWGFPGGLLANAPEQAQPDWRRLEIAMFGMVWVTSALQELRRSKILVQSRFWCYTI
jgi:hypothetical protein